MPRQIVIVEDTEAVRGLHVTLLRRWGCRVIEAADGRTGLALIRDRRPDLVLLDIMMPGLSGHEVLQALRSDPDPQVRAVPVIMTTAVASREMVAAIGALGVSGYLVKPITRERFDREIRRVLGDPVAAEAPTAPTVVVDAFGGIPVVVLPSPVSATLATLGDAMARTMTTLAQAGHSRVILDLQAMRTLAPGAPHLVAEVLSAARARRLRVAAVADDVVAAALNAIAETRATYRATRDEAWAHFTGSAASAA
jgi:CheY-like chemotaxis protein